MEPQTISPVANERRVELRTGDLAATFLPDKGMLGASLRFHGEELLRRIEDLDTAAVKGSTAGIPLLHPWANRLAGTRYRAAEKDVRLDLASPLLHLDEHGQPIHGVPWGRLRWIPEEVGPRRLAANLEWTRPDLLAVFPFPHRLELVATLDGGGLLIETKLVAAKDGPVPVSFGFHPYFGLPRLSRADWNLRAPGMQQALVDGRGIPTGAMRPFEGWDGPLGARSFDDGFMLNTEHAEFSLSGAGTRIQVEFIEGYGWAQIFAPAEKEFVAIEPMTAPTNALVSGRELRVVPAGGSFSAAFRISIDAIH